MRWGEVQEDFVRAPEACFVHDKCEVPVVHPGGNFWWVVRYEGLEFWEEIQAKYRNVGVASI